MNRIVKVLILLSFYSIFSMLVFADPMPEIKLSTMDTPNDKGESISLNWGYQFKDMPNAKKVLVMRKSEKDSDFKQIKEIDLFTKSMKDNATEDKLKYVYLLKVVNDKGEEIFKTPESEPTISKPQWFNKGKLVAFIISILCSVIVLLFIQLAKTGMKFYIRPLAGIKAIDEAVGRATEMGKPIIFVPGISVIEDISTLASISVCSKVAELVATYNSRLIVPNYDPIVYSVIDDVVKNSFSKVGRPDAYRSEDIYYLTGRQFAYASAISGIMAREKPAANFFLGYFMAESLILAEAGAMTGAIQIAGTDSVSQIPFFITSCDYTLIGEELYAAGAYLGDNKQIIGGLKGQDYVKLLLMVTVVVLFIIKFFNIANIETILIGG